MKTVDSKDWAYSLSDEELMKQLAEIEVKLLPPHAFPGLNEKPQLTEWERSFAAGIQTSWVKFGSLTWKQRKKARLVLMDVVDREQRRVELAKVRMRAAADADDTALEDAERDWSRG